MKFKNNIHTVTKTDIIQFRNFESWLKIIRHKIVVSRFQSDAYVRIDGYGTISDEIGYIYGFNFSYRKYLNSDNRGLDITPVKTMRSRYKKNPRIQLRFSDGVKAIIKQRLKRDFG